MVSKRIQCSQLVREIVERISRSQTSSVREVDRSELLLLLLSGHSNRYISLTYGYNWNRVKRWRDRWLSYEGIFEEIESRSNKYHMEHDVEQAVRACLSDAPRIGGPSKFTSEEYCRILGVSLEDPSLSGRPISQWTLDELRDEVSKRGIVSDISRSHLGAFLKGERDKAAQDTGLAQSEM
jgi:putative transposase